jgi:hypothetical protein
MAKPDIEAGDIQRRHLTVLLRLGDPCIVGGEWMGLKEDTLADCSCCEAVKNNAGLTEETDKKIQEAVQNCH